MWGKDDRELTWLLLDRGADPTTVLRFTKPDSDFAEDVKNGRKSRSQSKGQGQRGSPARPDGTNLTVI